jgi:hydroxyacylglutathione hydrolase
MRVVPVPCLSDNYAYLVSCEATGHVAVVDPGEAAPVVAALEREGGTLRAIWNTHHHPDHVGGNRDLLSRWPDLEVIGHEHDRDRIPGLTRAVADGDHVALGRLDATIVFNPGHTRGAISYHVAGGLFTGDTLFGAGCGRLFEGTAAEMQASLARLAALPGDTQVYCGHEYTAANLAFAAAVEPDNPAIAERRKAVAAARAAGKPSVPFSLLAELTTNPFLRVQIPEVSAAARAREPADGAVAVFAALRRWKDGFRVPA